MADEVNLRTTLGRPFLATVDTPQVADLLLEIVPSQAVAQVRMPLNVSFVLDSFSEYHATFYGKIKSFVIRPVKEGVYKFVSPETSAPSGCAERRRARIR